LILKQFTAVVLGATIREI